MKTVYLAGAIDHASPDFAVGWRREATERLEAAGYKVLDPTIGKDFSDPNINTTAYTPKQIVETDKAMIKRADILLVEMSRDDIPYVGTSMEILYAWERSKQIVVWGGPKSYWVRYHATKILDTLPEALAYIERGKSMADRIGAIRERVERIRANCYPEGWTADPMFSVVEDLSALIEACESLEFGRGPASAP